MSVSTHNGKIFTVVIILFVAAISAVGYFGFTDTLNGDKPAAAVATPAATNTTPDAKPAADVKAAATDDKKVAATATPSSLITAPQSDDIVIGKADAPVTIIDYASLSCPHCAHFHKEILPDLQKEFIDTGKAKLVFRHFPLNEPALRAAQLVNCADAKKRVEFLKMLFDDQGNWAYTESFLKELKPLAAKESIDSAAFDSCIADKAGETRILDVRRAAAEVGQVNSTPSFFINGVMLQGGPTVDNFRDAITKVATK